MMNMGAIIRTTGRILQARDALCHRSSTIGNEATRQLQYVGFIENLTLPGATRRGKNRHREKARMYCRHVYHYAGKVISLADSVPIL